MFIIPSTANINTSLFGFVQFLLLVICVLTVLGLLKWLFNKDDSIIILPFDTNSDLYNGQILANLLTSELIKIQDIYSSHSGKFKSNESFFLKFKNRLLNKFRNDYKASLTLRGSIYFYSTLRMNANLIHNIPMYNCLPITLYEEKLEAKMSGIGEIGYSGITKLNIDKLLVGMKDLWLFSKPRYYLKGYLQIDNSTKNLVNVVVLAGSPNAHAWKITEKVDNNDQMLKLIRNLAYQISFDLSKEKNKLSFKLNAVDSYFHLTNSYDYYNRYLDTKKISFLRESICECKEATKKELKNPVLFNILGSLLTQYSLYFEKRKDYKNANLELEKAIRSYNCANNSATDDFSGLPEILDNLGTILLIKYTWVKTKTEKESLSQAMNTTYKKGISIVKEENPYYPYIHYGYGNSLMLKYCEIHEDDALNNAISEYYKSLKYLSKTDYIYPAVLNNLSQALIHSYKAHPNNRNSVFKLREAITLLQKASVYLEGSSQCIPVLNNLSYGLMELSVKTFDYSCLNEANVIINQAMDMAPPDYSGKPSLYNTLGNILRQSSMEKGKLNQKVIECFNTAINLDPQYDCAYYNLACYYASSNHLSEAITNLDKAIKLDCSCFWKKVAQTDCDFEGCKNNAQIKKLLSIEGNDAIQK